MPVLIHLHSYTINITGCWDKGAEHPEDHSLKHSAAHLAAAENTACVCQGFMLKY